MYYTTEKPLPAELRAVYRLVIAGTDEQREAVENVLNEFFVLTDAGWINTRADTEIDAMREKQQKQREKANKRWQKPKAEPGTASAMPRHEQSDAAASKADADAMPPTPTPTPTPKEEGESPRKRVPPTPRPDDVAEQVWADWLALRRAKRAPVSDTTVAEARREADKAHLPLQRFLEIWVGRGSQGLQADWLKPHELRSAGGETAYQRSSRERMQQVVPRIAAQAPGQSTIIEMEVPNVIAGCLGR